MWRESRPCGGAAATEYETERARATIIGDNIRSVCWSERVGEGCGEQKGAKGGCYWAFRGGRLVRRLVRNGKARPS